MRFTSFLVFFVLFAVVLTKETVLSENEITALDVKTKGEEIMGEHPVHKNLTHTIAKRMLENYLDHLDPNKSYFVEEEIINWSNPSDETLNLVITDFNQADFKEFAKIQSIFQKAIERKRILNEKIDLDHLPTNVKAAEFKNSNWTKTEEELLQRIERIKALQLQTAAHFSNEETREKWLDRIFKRQKKYEEKVYKKDEKEFNLLVYSNVLKALASSLDTHTCYFTPEEAVIMMSHVQQMLRGIGVELRENLNGLIITKILEGSPAAKQKELKIKDRIIAVNDEPILGMDVEDAVGMIRGEIGTPVKLTVMRETSLPDGEKKEDKIDITIVRGEVAIKEARYDSSYEPYGEGVIGYLTLHSFYQDSETSSGQDLKKEIEELKNKHQLLGIVLDLRENTGGLLVQALKVTSLFIQKGVVASIRYDDGKIQHLRNMHGSPIWDGPLIVLVDRHSASASEIVAKTLQEYGRALIVGDDRTFGKGSFQIFTLSTEDGAAVNPKGEFKVTKGCYYTVSGQTPQLVGVKSDIVVPGPYMFDEVGEQFSKYPLVGDRISPNFVDTFSDLPNYEREHVQNLYAIDAQKIMETYLPYQKTLQSNTECRLFANEQYQRFKKNAQNSDEITSDEIADMLQNDFQKEEALRIMKDLLFMMKQDGFFLPTHKHTAL